MFEHKTFFKLYLITFENMTVFLLALFLIFSAQIRAISEICRKKTRKRNRNFSQTIGEELEVRKKGEG